MGCLANNVGGLQPSMAAAYGLKMMHSVAVLVCVVMYARHSVFVVWGGALKSWPVLPQ